MNILKIINGHLAIIIFISILFILYIVFIVSRIKKCPSDKIMVIYGMFLKDKAGSKKSAICIHGGVKFILPFYQAYQFLDLHPIEINIDFSNYLTENNLNIKMPKIFTVGISTKPGVMENAAEKLLGLPKEEIKKIAKDIIFGEFIVLTKNLYSEEINEDLDQFLKTYCTKIEEKIKLIGLRLINVGPGYDY